MFTKSVARSCGQMSYFTYCKPSVYWLKKQFELICGKWEDACARLYCMKYRWRWDVWGEREGAYRVFMGTPAGKRPPGSHRRRWKDDIKMYFQAMGERGLILLSIETNGGLLWTWRWIFGFYEMWGMSWLAEERLPFQERLCCIELRR
jgi:hypothetical protein